MAEMELYLECDRGRNYQRVTLADVNHLTRNKEWATLRKHERGPFLEVVLELEWGDPSLANP